MVFKEFPILFLFCILRYANKHGKVNEIYKADGNNLKIQSEVDGKWHLATIV